MSLRLAAGWEIVHLTDRVLEARKADPAYVRLTGRPGFVRVRVDPDTGREVAFQKLEGMCRKNDEKVALLYAKGALPDLVRLARYKNRQKQLANVFGLREQEPEQRIYRP